MKMIALAVVAAGLLGAAAAVLLRENNIPAYEAFSTSGTRVSHPGDNLVGPRWTGDAVIANGAAAGASGAHSR